MSSDEQRCNFMIPREATICNQRVGGSNPSAGSSLVMFVPRSSRYQSRIFGGPSCKTRIRLLPSLMSDCQRPPTRPSSQNSIARCSLDSSEGNVRASLVAGFAAHGEMRPWNDGNVYANNADD